MKKDYISIPDIDFSNLISYENVLKLINKDENFRERFKSDRRSQIMISFSQHPNIKEKFESILGQFLIEREIHDNDDRLRSEDELHSLWLDGLIMVEKNLNDTMEKL